MGPSKEALALADFLIARYGLTADRYQLAYAIMEHEEKAMRAEPEQVGEVQGDALLESLVVRWRSEASAAATSDNVLCQKIANCTMRHVAELKDALAARQPVVQEPDGWEIYNDAGQYVIYVKSKSLRDAHLYRADNTLPEWTARPRYAAPPAQAVDLGAAVQRFADRYVSDGTPNGELPRDYGWL